MDNIEIIRAKIKDDVVVLIDRIMRASLDNIVIVLPENSIIAANLNSLKTLKDEAESIDKALLIVASNEKIKAKSKDLKIPVYDTLEEVKLTHSKDSGFISRMEAVETEIIPIATELKTITRMVDIIAPDTADPSNDDISEDDNNQDDEDVKIDALIPPAADEMETSDFDKDEEAGREVDNQNMKLNFNLPEKNDLEKGIEEFYGDKPSRVQTAKIGFRFNGFFGRIFAPSRLIVLLVLLSLAAAGGSLYLVLPKAVITLTTKTNQINATVPVTVSKNTSSVDEAAGIIPGQFFSASKAGAKTFTVRGSSEKTVSTYARGNIHIYNAYGASPQKLVAGTRFETKDGKIFKIQKAIIIPGAKVSGGKLVPSVIDAEVTASQPGEEYNIGAEYFTIPGFQGSPKYAGFYAKSTENMSGGKVGTAKVLSTADFEAAKSELQNELIDALKQEIMGASQTNLKIIDGASVVKLVNLKSSAKVGDAVDSYTIEAKVDWQAIAFREQDLVDVTTKFLGGKYPAVDTGQIKDSISLSKPQIDWLRGEMTLLVSINDNLASSVNIENLKNSVAGKGTEDIRRVIAGQPQIQSATITFSPFWVTSAPQDPSKINIMVLNGK